MLCVVIGRYQRTPGTSGPGLVVVGDGLAVVVVVLVDFVASGAVAAAEMPAIVPTVPATTSTLAAMRRRIVLRWISVSMGRVMAMVRFLWPGRIYQRTP
jgi:hypothetical protein